MLTNRTSTAFFAVRAFSSVFTNRLPAAIFADRTMSAVFTNLATAALFALRALFVVFTDLAATTFFTLGAPPTVFTKTVAVLISLDFRHFSSLCARAQLKLESLQRTVESHISERTDNDLTCRRSAITKIVRDAWSKFFGGIFGVFL